MAVRIEYTVANIKTRTIVIPFRSSRNTKSIIFRNCRAMV